MNSHFSFLTCGFEFWGGVKTWRSQAKYYSHIHKCQHEAIPVVLLRFILLQLKTDTHVCALQKDKCLHLSQSIKAQTSKIKHTFLGLFFSQLLHFKEFLLSGLKVNHFQLQMVNMIIFHLEECSVFLWFLFRFALFIGGGGVVFVCVCFGVFCLFSFVWFCFPSNKFLCSLFSN